MMEVDCSHGLRLREDYSLLGTQIVLEITISINGQRLLRMVSLIQANALPQKTHQSSNIPLLLRHLRHQWVEDAGTKTH